MEIEIIRGTTNNLIINIVSETTGENYEPTPGDRVVFALKRQMTDVAYALVKREIVVNDGTAVITLCPEDTISLYCDKYYYDVALESGDNFYNVIPPTPFYIKNNITAKGCSNA